MTREAQKRRERFFVEQAAKSLGLSWTIEEDREHPDFVIGEADRRFGLEVSEIFMGLRGPAGSAMKKTESKAQRAIDALRREYEERMQIILRVQLVGNMSAENTAEIVPALIAEDLASKPVGHHVVIDTGRGLRAHATKAFRSEWFSVNHCVGWVDRNSLSIIEEAVQKKAAELARYRAAAGADIRLLLVANRIHNSGKLSPDAGAAVNTQGFEAVYFFPYPEPVTVFDGSRNAA